MAKEKATKETTKEITFNCKFCGESKPLSEMTFMTRFFPILVACRSCDETLQSLKLKKKHPRRLKKLTRKLLARLLPLTPNYKPAHSSVNVPPVYPGARFPVVPLPYCGRPPCRLSVHPHRELL